MEISCCKVHNLSSFDIRIKIIGSELIFYYKYAYSRLKDTLQLPITKQTPFKKALKIIDFFSIADKAARYLLCKNDVKISNFAQDFGIELTKINPCVAFKQISLVNVDAKRNIHVATEEALEFSFRLDYYVDLNLTDELLDKIFETPYLFDADYDIYMNNIRLSFIKDANLKLLTLKSDESEPPTDNSLVAISYSFQHCKPDERELFQTFDTVHSKIFTMPSLKLIPDIINDDIVTMKINEPKKILLNVSPDYQKYPMFSDLFLHPQFPIKPFPVLLTYQITKHYKCQHTTLTDELLKQTTKFESVADLEMYYTEIYKLKKKYQFSDKFFRQAALALFPEYPNIELKDCNLFVNEIRYPPHIDPSKPFKELIENKDFNYKETILRNIESPEDLDPDQILLLKVENLYQSILHNLDQNITITQLIIENVICEFFDQLPRIPLVEPLTNITKFFKDLNSYFDSLLELFNEEIKKAPDCIPFYSPKSLEFLTHCQYRGITLFVIIDDCDTLDIEKDYKNEIVFDKEKYVKSKLYKLLKESQKFFLRPFTMCSLMRSCNYHMEPIADYAMIRAYSIVRTQKK
ncbi:MAG: hypothetical protein LBF12_06215 [Christensenellaceae bacterium]|jgi:hypothetical protein|nr:hypothetical protein [Christensenellaceae bacterium]